MNKAIVAPLLRDGACQSGRLASVVAIPVRNERERIGACLQALAAQVGLQPDSFGILLFLNNCNDGTAEAIDACRDKIPWPIRLIEVIEEQATAGWARRCAMDAAATWLAEHGDLDGIILTSDADSRVGNDWVARNLAYIASGADAVAGRISLDMSDAALLPASLHARGRLEAEYEALLTEIGARLDPDPTNPWPCHWTRSGATLAVRRAVYETIGGMPALPHGEDRAFVEALRAADFVVRHAMDIEVTTSGRLDGRAPGGAADTMKLRCAVPDSPCDDRLERLSRAVARVMWRRWLRNRFAKRRLAATWTWAPLTGISRGRAEAIARVPTFNRVHAEIEAASSRLAYRPLPPSRLLRQSRLATVLVKILRMLDGSRHAGRRVGTPAIGSDAAPAQTRPMLP